MTHCPPPRPAQCPSNESPPLVRAWGTPWHHPRAPLPNQRHTCPGPGDHSPPPPQPPQQRSTDPFDDAELRALYGIHTTTSSSELVAAFREHLRDVNPGKLFHVVPLPHAATTKIFVRQLQVLVTPGTQMADDLVDAWICWFDTHQPAQGGVWVPHLGWAHTLIAPPTDPRPAPSTGGGEQAAPPPRAETLRIPPYEGLAEWESGTARDRGRNLTSMAERYPETARAAPPPRERDPSTIAMIVLENGHCYQVRITPHPQESPSSLEAVGSMRPATAALPDSPTPLINGQPPDPLMAIVSGTVGTSTASGGGHGAAGRTPGYVRRHGGSTWTAGSSWRPPPSASGRQRPPLRPTCAPSLRSTRSGRWRWASNCSPPSAMRRRPRGRTRPLCTKSSVPSAAPSCSAWETPQGPEPP